jgi:hypothetical protein
MPDTLPPEQLTEIETSRWIITTPMPRPSGKAPGITMSAKIIGRLGDFRPHKRSIFWILAAALVEIFIILQRSAIACWPDGSQALCAWRAPIRAARSTSTVPVVGAH